MGKLEQARATLEDLYQTPEKAELIDGRIVKLTSTGRKPGRVGFRIAQSLDGHAAQTGKGEAYPDNVGFAVPVLASGRESFAPDASYYEGPFPEDPMRFLPGPPRFAAEVRSENDYGPAAELELADKRADYFEAGTLVVWDVDPINEEIHVYRKDRPENPTTYNLGQEAEAEPAVPGWRVKVDWVFGSKTQDK